MAETERARADSTNAEPKNKRAQPIACAHATRACGGCSVTIAAILAIIWRAGDDHRKSR
jgi:hypothetical protein